MLRRLFFFNNREPIAILIIPIYPEISNKDIVCDGMFGAKVIYLCLRDLCRSARRRLTALALFRCKSLGNKSAVIARMEMLIGARIENLD